MSTGKIVQVIGAVIDVEFSRDNTPKVYDALKVEETSLVLRSTTRNRRWCSSYYCYGF